MARRSTGGVIERRTTRGTVYALRFRAHGKRQYVTVGAREDGYTRAMADEELANVLADVRRGTWCPPEQAAPQAVREAPTFHEFASEWLKGRVTAGLRPRSIEYLRWALTHHLLPAFAETRVDAITIEDVDRYAQR